MSEKDMTEKTLESFNDVFADIANVLLFKVRRLISEDDLTPEAKLFKSDFRIVADYFVQMRKNQDYVPSKETITHVHEVLQLMSVMTSAARSPLICKFWKTLPRTMS